MNFFQWGRLGRDLQRGQVALEQHDHEGPRSLWRPLDSFTGTGLIRAWSLSASETLAALLSVCTWRWGGASKGQPWRLAFKVD